MNLVKIICPKCGAEKKLSLVESSYSGPQRCWKCRELFTITIHNNQVSSTESLSEDDFRKQMEEKAAREGNTNFKFSDPFQDDDIPRLSSERRRNYEQPLNLASGGTPVQAEPGQPQPETAPEGGQDEPESPENNPPDRFRTFVPMEDNPEEPPPQEKPKNPPDRPRFFIPPAT